jgi:sec-independent protein translocase protein TatB
MFDIGIGWSELLVVAVVAVLVFGPKDLPRIMRSLGHYAGKMRRTANEFRQQFDDAIRESELDELRTSVESIGDPTREIKESMEDTMTSLRRAGDDVRREAEKPVPLPATEPVKTEAVTSTKPATPELAAPAEHSAAEVPAGAAGSGR